MKPFHFCYRLSCGCCTEKSVPGETIETAQAALEAELNDPTAQLLWRWADTELQEKTA